MAQMSARNVTQRLEHEPAVGAGSMVIAFAEAMVEQHDAATIANLLNSDEPESVNSLSPFVHAQWYGVCVDEGTGTVKCDTQAQNRAAEPWPPLKLPRIERGNFRTR